VIEARERARGDRTPGLARWQHDKVHAGIAYDLELDAAAATPVELAGRTREAFGQ
jgi:chloramphenicol 3-O phosphotransferase